MLRIKTSNKKPIIKADMNEAACNFTFLVLSDSFHANIPFIDSPKTSENERETDVF